MNKFKKKKDLLAKSEKCRNSETHKYRLKTLSLHINWKNKQNIVNKSWIPEVPRALKGNLGGGVPSRTSNPDPVF